MEDYAHLEWYWFKTMNENHITVEEISTSNLHCYCDEQRDKLGTWEASQIKAEKEGNGKVPKVKGFLCWDYLYYDRVMYLIDFLIPWIILILNEVLKSISEKGVKWIQYETRSEEIQKIQSAVFILNFINGGLTLLLINANFTGSNALPS